MYVLKDFENRSTQGKVMGKSTVSFFDSRKAVPIFHWGKKEGPKIEVELPIPKAESWLGFPLEFCIGPGVSEN